MHKKPKNPKNPLVVGITPAAGAQPLSKAQKSFNNQIKQIETLRATLAAWEAALPPFYNGWTRDFLPLVEESAAWDAKIVRALDAASNVKGMGKRQRAMLVELIVALAGALATERDDAEMKAIYNKHSGYDFDTEVQEDVDLTKALFEEIFNLDLGDEPINSEEELDERVEAEMRRKQLGEAAAAETTEPPPGGKKPSAAQRAKEKQQAQEAAQISQSIREIYRKLVSTLHPDREPDAAERTRKTQLMQRVNQAYDKRNLLVLLELQLELEHIDAAHIGQLNAEKLRYYNLILEDQIDELKQELMRVEARFRMDYDISSFEEIGPEDLPGMLKENVEDMRQSIRQAEQDLQCIADKKLFKNWLKQRHAQVVDDLDDLDDLDIFGGLDDDNDGRSMPF